MQSINSLSKIEQHNILCKEQKISDDIAAFIIVKSTKIILKFLCYCLKSRSERRVKMDFNL